MSRALGRELLVTRERQPRLRKKKRARRHAETSKDLSRAGDGSQERPSRGGEHAEPAELESLSLDGMPDQLNKHLNKQKEFIHGLVELLKESLDDMPAELNEQGELTAGLACSPPRLGRSWEPSPAHERSFEVSAWRRALSFFPQPWLPLSCYE